MSILVLRNTVQMWKGKGLYNTIRITISLRNNLITILVVGSMQVQGLLRLYLMIQSNYDVVRDLKVVNWQEHNCEQHCLWKVIWEKKDVVHVKESWVLLWLKIHQVHQCQLDRYLVLGVILVSWYMRFLCLWICCCHCWCLFYATDSCDDSYDDEHSSNSPLQDDNK